MQNQEYEIDLVEIAKLLFYRWKVIVASIIACAAVVYIYSSRPVTQYAVNMSFAVGTTVTARSSSVSSINGSPDSLFGIEATINNESEEEKTLSTTFSDAVKATQYCGAIVKSDTVLQPVIDNLNLDVTTSELSGSITATQMENIPVLQVTVTRSNADEALQIAQTIAELAPEIITNVTKISNVTVISDPSSSYVVTKSVSRNVMLGAVAGFALSAGVLVIWYLMSTLIRKEEDITNMLGVKVLGVIPAAKEGTENA